MIYHIVENSCYQRLTNGLAIPNMAKQLGIECKTYSIYEFQNAIVDRDSSQDAVFIAESAFFRDSLLDARQLRRLIPNGKLINMASDSIYFTRKNDDEFYFLPEYFDLWLDTMEECKEYYQSKGLFADIWRWTISDKYIDLIDDYLFNLQEGFMYEPSKKEKDYVCLARLNSIYRQQLKHYLDENRLKGTFGTGALSSDLKDLYELYNTAWVAIGTTSPAGQDDIRTMKGFRDWIAPFFGTVLVYDDHPEMNWASSVLPRYDYNDFPDLKAFIIDVKHYPDLSKQYIKKQKAFILNHTIEKQLINLFRKHSIIK
jgi:hypothetical protein